MNYSNIFFKALGKKAETQIITPKKDAKMTIDITISLPKTAHKPPKRKVRVFSNFVKVGWDQYSIKVNPYTGSEYVLIKGKRYEVVRDIFGQGYLVEI